MQGRLADWLKLNNVYFAGQLKSMDMAEVNPALGTPEQSKTTIGSAVELMKAALLKE